MKKQNAVPAVDTIDPGFKFRWKDYDKKFTGTYSKLPVSLFVKYDKDGYAYPSVWADISHAAKAVLPVLVRLAHGNDLRQCWPNEDYLAAMAGINTLKTVRNACGVLEDFKLITTKKVTLKNGRRSKRYTLTFNDEGHFFPMFTSVFEGACWSGLGKKTVTAQALYPVMRAFAKPNPALDPDCVDESGEMRFHEREYHCYDREEYEDYYRKRKCDFCCAELDVLIDHAGICANSYQAAIKALVDGSFIAMSEFNPEYWMVRFMDGWAATWADTGGAKRLNSRLKIT